MPSRQPRNNTTKKRGGQPNNLNALKHGFYSRRFKKLEITDLDTAFEYGLDNEISMLRVITRRVFDLSEGFDKLDNAICALNALGLAAARLSSLLRTQFLLEGDTSDLSSIISDALANVVNELNIK